MTTTGEGELGMGAPSVPARRLVRGAVLRLAIFGLMLASFLADRLTVNSNHLPAIVATLAGR